MKFKSKNKLRRADQTNTRQSNKGNITIEIDIKCETKEVDTRTENDGEE